MTAAVTQILEAVEHLSPAERADIIDRLVENSTEDVNSNIVQAQLSVVRERIAEVEAGRVELISSGEVFAEANEIVASGQMFAQIEKQITALSAVEAPRLR